MVDPSEFLDDLGRLQSRLEAQSSASVPSQAERHHIRSVVGAWFQYRQVFLGLLGDEQLLAQMDSLMERVLELTAAERARTTVTRALRAARRFYTDSLLLPLTRAYWSRAPEMTPAGRDDEVALRLLRLDADIAESYEQAVRDLANRSRITYRGAAAELREVLTGVLHQLAPNQEIQKMDWYKEARKSGVRTESTPTRVERVRFILRGRGSAAVEAADSYGALVEDRLGKVVDATYRRGSAGTHGAAELEEVRQVLRYLNALLREILPAPRQEFPRTD